MDRDAHSPIAAVWEAALAFVERVTTFEQVSLRAATVSVREERVALMLRYGRDESPKTATIEIDASTSSLIGEHSRDRLTNPSEGAPGGWVSDRLFEIWEIIETTVWWENSEDEHFACRFE